MPFFKCPIPLMILTWHLRSFRFSTTWGAHWRDHSSPCQWIFFAVSRQLCAKFTGLNWNRSSVIGLSAFDGCWITMEITYTNKPSIITVCPTSYLIPCAPIYLPSIIRRFPRCRDSFLNSDSLMPQCGNGDQSSEGHSCTGTCAHACVPLLLSFDGEFPSQ
jgi:hypothetical protein